VNCAGTGNHWRKPENSTFRARACSRQQLAAGISALAERAADAAPASDVEIVVAMGAGEPAMGAMKEMAFAECVETAAEAKAGVAAAVCERDAAHAAAVEKTGVAKAVEERGAVHAAAEAKIGVAVAVEERGPLTAAAAAVVG
jgi:hypothetical protein